MEYDIKINEQDVHVIMQALGELPVKVAVNTYIKLNNQILEQQSRT